MRCLLRQVRRNAAESGGTFGGSGGTFAGSGGTFGGSGGTHPDTGGSAGVVCRELGSDTGGFLAGRMQSGVLGSELAPNW